MSEPATPATLPPLPPPSDDPARTLRAVAIGVALAVLVLAAGWLTSCAEKQEPIATPAPAPVPAPPKPDADNQVDRPSEAARTHEDARDEKPPGVTEEEIEQGEEQSDRAERYSLERPSNGGAQSISCATRYVRNRSSRGGVRPTMFVLHYTVSSNRPGIGDLNAIRGLFNSPSFGASSTYGIDFAGNCQQWVPESQKPWTNGTQNPRSITVEIIATGRESRAQWLASPLIRNGRLAALARDSMRRNGIPLRRVDPVGCGAPAGWTDHDSLECGNSHTDVRPTFPYDVFARQLRAGEVDAPPKVVVWSRRVEWLRSEVRKNHKTTPEMRRLARERIALLKLAGYVSTAAGPVKR